MFGMSPHSRRKKGNELVPDRGAMSSMVRIETMTMQHSIDRPEVQKPVKNRNRESKRESRKNANRNVSPKRSFLRKITRRDTRGDSLSRSLDGDMYSGEVTLATGSTQSTGSGFFRRERFKPAKKAEASLQRDPQIAFQVHGNSSVSDIRRLSLPSAYALAAIHSMLPAPPILKPHEVVVAMLESRKKSNMLDVCLVSVDGTKVATSRYVMACRVEKLEGLLYPEDGEKPREISLGAYSITTLNALVEYCFCGELPKLCSKETFESVNRLVGLFELALSLEFTTLREETFRLTRLLVSQDPGLACALYDCATSLDELENYAIQNIGRKPQDALLDSNEPGVRYLSPERFEKLISNRSITMDPLTLFQVISRWVEEQGRTDAALETAQKCASKIELQLIDPILLQGTVRESCLFDEEEIDKAVVKQVFDPDTSFVIDTPSGELTYASTTDLSEDLSGKSMPSIMVDDLARQTSPPTPPAPKHHQVIQALLNAQRKDHMLDISLIGKNGTTVKTSRYIVACRAEALEQVLYPDAGETVSEVNLEDYSATTLKAFVEYCFCGEFCVSFKEETAQTALDMGELAKLASSLRFRELGDAVYQLARRKMNRSPSLACAIFDCAKSSRELETYALQIIEESPNEAFLLGDKCGISYISPARLEELLTQHETELDELIVVKMLSRWVEERGNTAASLELARKHAKDIDLHSISVEDLHGIVHESGLFEQEAVSKAVLEHMFANRRKKPRDNLERVEVEGAGVQEVNGTYLRKLDRDGQAMFYLEDGPKGICMFQWDGRWGIGPSHDLSNMFYECHISDDTSCPDEYLDKDQPPSHGWEVSLQGEHPPPKCSWIAGSSQKVKSGNEKRLPACFISEEDLLGN